MNDLTLATTPADSAAIEVVEQHHAQLAGALAVRASSLLRAAAEGSGVEAAREELIRWTESELVPHALAEEAALYPAGRKLGATRLLVDAMLAEHAELTGLLGALRAEREPVASAALGKALQVLFDSHVAKENERLLPALAAEPGLSVAELLTGMHAALDDQPRGAGRDEAPSAGGAPHGHSCACGETEAAGYPELDARAVPHAIRHATIFGALDGVRRGGGLVLVAPHDPLPLLAQIEAREPGAFDVSYLEQGPEAWRLQFVRL